MSIFDYSDSIQFINENTTLSTYPSDSHIYKIINLTVRNSKLTLENFIIYGTISLNNNAEIIAKNCVFINSNLNECTFEFNNHSQGYFENCTFYDNGGVSAYIKSKSFISFNNCSFYINSIAILCLEANVYVRNPIYYFFDCAKPFNSKITSTKNKSDLLNFLYILNPTKNIINQNKHAYFLSAKDSLCTVIGNNLMFESDYVYYKNCFENYNFSCNNINSDKQCYHYFIMNSNIAIRDLCLITNNVNTCIFINNSNIHIENSQIHTLKTLMLLKNNSVLEVINSYLDSTYGNILNMHHSVGVCLNSVFEVQNSAYPPVLVINSSMQFNSCSLIGGNINISIKTLSRVEFIKCILSIKRTNKMMYQQEMNAKNGIVYNGSCLKIDDCEIDSSFDDCNNKEILEFLNIEENHKMVVSSNSPALRNNNAQGNGFYKMLFVMKRDLVMNLKNVDIEKLNALSMNSQNEYIKCNHCKEYINSERDYIIFPCCHWICKKCVEFKDIDDCKECHMRISNIKKINYRETCVKCNLNRSNVIYGCGCMNMCIKCMSNSEKCVQCDKCVETYCFENRMFK